MADWLDNVRNPFLRAHLVYVHNTESPRIMHLWSAITCASACMGRHLWLETGIGPLYPNLYVLLVGPPGTRKSSAINYAANIVEEHTPVRFSPDDTSGQRKGLIRALTSDRVNINGTAQQIFDAATDAFDAADLLGGIDMGEVSPDRYCIFMRATEFGSFLGHNSLDLTRFLIKLYDCESYTYQISDELLTIPDTCGVILGGTTATDMAAILPPEAMGQGFMSRVILVSAQEKEKSVDEPTLDSRIVEELKAGYVRLNSGMSGALSVTPLARERLKFLYHKPPDMKDHRFMFYSERRHVQLQKTATILAALDDTMALTETHVDEADMILKEAERTMPDALGEYGLSPVAAARQKMFEYLSYQKEPISDAALWAVMQRDMRMIDFRNSIAALKNGGKIHVISSATGTHYVAATTTAAAVRTLEPRQINDLFGIGEKNVHRH